MRCERCGNNATSYIHQNVNGHSSEVWLCAECFSKVHIGGLGGMLFSLGGFGKHIPAGSAARAAGDTASAKKLRCDVCGYSLKDIADSGKVGCANCYSVFGEQMKSVIVKIHGNCSHTGKLPGRRLSDCMQSQQAQPKQERSREEQSQADNRQLIMSLKEQMKIAVAKEEYEKAATLRDRIKLLEGKQ